MFKKTECIKTERYNEAKMLNNKQKSVIFTEREKANDNIDKKIKKLDEVQNNYYKKIKDNINYIKKFVNSQLIILEASIIKFKSEKIKMIIINLN